MTLLRFFRPLPILAIAGVLACVTSPTAQGQSPDDSQAKASAAVLALQQSLADLIEKVEPAVVAIHRAPSEKRPAAVSNPVPPLTSDSFIRITPSPFRPVGAGVVIDSDGLILTQFLNVRAGDRHTITTTSGEAFPAKIKAADPRSGLAVLEIDLSELGSLELTALELGDADKLHKGYFVVAISNPHAIAADGEPTASWGIVSNIAQKASPTTNLNNVADEFQAGYNTTLHHLGTLLQTDAKLGWSAGGGALVNIEGKLVGITTTAGTLPGHESPAGYAIPMNETFRRVVNQLKEGREVEYGLLGVGLSTPNGQRADQTVPVGARVQSVVSGGAAHQTGIQVNDVLTDIDGERIRGPQDIHLLVGSMPPGKQVAVGLLRGGLRTELSVRLSKRYVQGEQVVTSAPADWRGIETDYSTALPPAELDRAARTGLLDIEGCVVVRRVVEESSAWQAGVRPGMFISHVGEQRVATPSEFREAVAGASETVDLRFTDRSEQKVGSDDRRG